MNTSVCHYQLLLGLFISLSLFVHVTSHTLQDNSESRSDSTLVAVTVSSIALLAVLVVVIFKCTDCYNSEVSSENHPACSDKPHKWGGADGYTSVSSRGPTAAFTTGETVELTQQSLPYTMIPTSVPASGGFQGYSPAGQGGDFQPSGGLAYQGSVRSNTSYGGAMHYNPVAPQEPPPAYETAAHGGSFHSNR